MKRSIVVLAVFGVAAFVLVRVFPLRPSDEASALGNAVVAGQVGPGMGSPAGAGGPGQDSPEGLVGGAVRQVESASAAGIAPIPMNPLETRLSRAARVDEVIETNVDGRTRRIRIYETDGWPRYLRTVERWRPGESGNGAFSSPVVMAAGHLLVQFVEAQPDQATVSRLEAEGLDLDTAINGEGLFRVEVSGFQRAGRIDELLAQLGRPTTAWRYMEPDYLVEIMTTVPNDPLHADQWSLRRFEGGIDAMTAWDAGTSGEGALVAVVDSGIRLTHEDLAPNLWVNTGEIPGNGLDDDANGFVDDVHGINAITGSGSPDDDHGHGTHVAGIIGARGDNGTGVAGVAWRVPLLAAKFISVDGTGLSSDAVRCLDYARTMGAVLVNASWGSSAESASLTDAVRRLEKAGIFLVASAGNAGADIDLVPVFPASARIGNVIGVGATDWYGDLWVHSNRGVGSVDIAAPGVGILSASGAADDAYERNSGTSMAAPHVTGALALLRGGALAFGPERALARLREAAVRDARLDGWVRGGLRLNLGEHFSSEFRPPANDRVERAVSLSGVSFNWVGSTIDATIDETEPAAPSAEFTRSVWLTMDPESGDRFSIRGRSRGDRLAIAVFDRTPAQGVAPLSRAIGALPGQEVSLVFDLKANGPLHVGVYGLSDGSAEVSVSGTIVQRNDHFADAIPIESTPFEVIVRTTGATRESGEPVYGANASGQSVWWSWTAPRSGQLALKAHTSGGTPFVMAVYEGATLDGLTLIGGNDDDPDDSPRAELVVEVLGGRTYHFIADRFDLYGRSAALTGAMATPLRVLVDLNDIRVDEGGVIELSIITAGNAEASYQWFKDGTPIPNANAAYLRLAGARVEDSGYYHLRVTSFYGTLQSRAALVLVGDSHPYVLSPPSVRKVVRDGTIVLSASVRGQAPFAYQWYKDGVPIDGAVSATLEITEAGDGDAGRYTLEVTNALGSHLGEPIDLRVIDDVGPSWNLRYPQAPLIALNRFVDMGEEVWALGTGRFLVWGEIDGWETREVDSGVDVLDGAFGAGRWVLTGREGDLLESTDGYSWTRLKLGEEPEKIRLASGNGVFVAMSSQAELWVSSQGGQWVPAALEFRKDITPELVFFRGAFFLVTSDPQAGQSILLRSVDGFSWSEVMRSVRQPTIGTHFFAGDDHLFLVDPGQRIFSTSDGVRWEDIGSAPLKQFLGRRDGVYLAIFGNGAIGLEVSDDLRKWRRSEVDPQSMIGLLHWRDERFFLGYTPSGTPAVIATTSRLDPEAAGTLPAFKGNDLASIGGLSWLAGEFQVGGLRSGDGLKWHFPDYAVSFDPRMSYGNGRFIAPRISSQGRHPETIRFDTTLVGSLGDPRKKMLAAFGFGVHAVISPLRVSLSVDGKDWSELPLGGDNSWNDFRFLNDRFMAVGSFGRIALGRTAGDWITFDSGYLGELVGMAHGSGRYVLTTGTETILLSGDGATWTEMIPAPGCALWDVAFGEGTFVLVGDGCSLVSADGQSWSRIEVTGPEPELREIEYGSGSFVAVTSGGEIYQFGDPAGRAPEIGFIQVRGTLPAGPLDRLEVEVEVGDPDGSTVVVQGTNEGDPIGEAGDGWSVFNLTTRSPGDYEVVIVATDEDGFQSSRAFIYGVNDYPGQSALDGAPAIASMAVFKNQLYRAGEEGIVQREAGEGIWLDLPSVPERRTIGQLFATGSDLYASADSASSGAITAVYRSRDGLSWEQVSAVPGRLEQAGSLVYLDTRNFLLLLDSDGVFRIPGFEATRIVEFAGSYVAGTWSPYSWGTARRVWISMDGVDFQPLGGLPGTEWQGPFTAGGQLIVRNSEDGQIRLSSDLINWDTESLPVDGHLYQAGSGLVIVSSLAVWYSNDGRTWQLVSEEGYGGTVQVGDTDLIISGKSVFALRSGQRTELAGELEYPFQSGPVPWKALRRPDGVIEVIAEGLNASMGSPSPRFRVDPVLSSIEVVAEVRRGDLRGYSLGGEHSAFLVVRERTGYLLLGRDPIAASTSGDLSGNGYDLVAGNGTIWVVAGSALSTRTTTDGTVWQEGELIEDYRSQPTWNRIYGGSPGWLVFHSPSNQFLAGWANGLSKTGWWRSTDGLSWTYQVVDESHRGITNVVSNGSILVGISGESWIAVCSDGLTWSVVDPGVTPRIRDLRMLSPDVFAFHDATGERIFTSADGQTWTQAIHPENGSPLRGSMIVSDDLPRILSNRKIWVSHDHGASWQFEESAGFAPARAGHLFHLNGQVFSPDLSSISGLADLSLELPDGADVVGGRGMEIRVPIRITNNATTGFSGGLLQVDWNLTSLPIWDPSEGDGLRRTSVDVGPLGAGESEIRELKVVLPETVDSGRYHFTAWLDSGVDLFEISETNNYASSASASVWIPAWSLEAVADEGGEVMLDPTRTRYANGERVVLVPRARPGFVFTGWEGLASSGLEVLTVVVDRDRVIRARFEPRFHLSLRAIGGGTVSVDPELTRYAPDSEVTVSAKPESGWRFANWQDDASGQLTETRLVMTRDRLVTARFDQTFALFSESAFDQSELDNAEISGPDADPDRDGFSNLQEFVMGTDPKSDADLPVIVASADGRTVSLIFTRRIGVAGYRAAAKGSTDLVTWSADGTTETILQSDGVREMVEGSTVRTATGPIFIQVFIDEVGSTQ